MSRDQFWLTKAQFSQIKPHLPTDTRGKARVDDRRVISGIVQVLKSGARWVDAPPEYGPRKTLYNRYVRWAAKGVWVGLFRALAQAGGPPAQVLIDSSAVKAHRSAAGGKGGRKSVHRPFARRPHDESPRADRHSMSPVCLHAHWRTSSRLTAGEALLERLPDCDILHADKGYALMRSVSRSSGVARCQTSRQRQIGSGRTASRHSSIATATPSSACSAA